MLKSAWLTRPSVVKLNSSFSLRIFSHKSTTRFLLQVKLSSTRRSSSYPRPASSESSFMTFSDDRPLTLCRLNVLHAQKVQEYGQPRDVTMMVNLRADMEMPFIRFW